MPAYSKEREQYHISRIRSILILRPDATFDEIAEALSASTEAPLALERHYISKLKKKIYAERLRRNDNLNRNARIAYIQDKKKVVEQRLWQEATNMKNPGVVRVMALEKIMKNELELLAAEMDAGCYERKIGTLDVNAKVEHQHTLAPELLDPIMRALRNYGLVKPKEIANENATATPALPGASPAANTNPVNAPGAAEAVPRI